MPALSPASDSIVHLATVRQGVRLLDANGDTVAVAVGRVEGSTRFVVAVRSLRLRLRDGASLTVAGPFSSSSKAVGGYLDLVRRIERGEATLDSLSGQGAS